MVKMPPEVKEILEKQKVIPLATASQSCVPNVIYIGILKILDDETLVLADNYFNKTATNMEENPRVAIVCWDPETRRSYQIKGKVVEFQDKGEIYSDMSEMIGKRRKDIKMRRAVIVKIEEIYNAASGPSAGTRLL